MATAFESVDDYIAARPEPARSVLARLRSTMKKALPKAEEVISYGIPAFKVGGRPVIYFAAWKQHYSVYPSTSAVVAAFKKELTGYHVSKGTIRFPFTEPIPLKLIRGIVRIRAREVEDAVRLAATRGRPKPASRKDRPAPKPSRSRA